MEEKLRELLQYAVDHLQATDEPYKRSELTEGLSMGYELLRVYDAIRKITVEKSFGEVDTDAILRALNPVAARYLGQILTHLGHGGLFGGGDNGRTGGRSESEN